MSRQAPPPSATIGYRNGSRQPDAALRQMVWERDGGDCGICGQPADPLEWNMDHIVPKALGGPDEEDNLRVTHPRCNRTRAYPWKMTDAEIEEAADLWAENELARISMDETGAVWIAGRPTATLLGIWWQMWWFHWGPDGQKRRRALVSA